MSRPSDTPRFPHLSIHNWRSGTVPPLHPDHAGSSLGTDRGAARFATKISNGAEAIVRQLVDMGLDTFFGIPGGPVIPMFHAILTHPGARLIQPRHETGAAFMAMGYYRASGKIPVVVVTTGPGATNVVTGVASAFFERIPMIVICGDVPWAASGRKLFQDAGPEGIAIESMLRPVTRAAIRIAHAGSAPGQVRAALQAATSPEQNGPALLVVSIDRAGTKAQDMELYSAPLSAAPRAAAPDPTLLREVVTLLRGAERPLVLVGPGCYGAQEQVLRLVDALGAPFVTTVMTKGLLPEDHPLSLRNCGLAGSRWARAYMESPVDVALVLGSDLNDTVISPVPPVGPGGVLIHVGLDSSVMGRNLPTAIGAVCDVRAFADALTTSVRHQGPPREPPAILRAIRAEPPFECARPQDDAATPPAPHRILLDLERAAAPETTFVSDMGEHVLFFLHYLTITGKRRCVAHFGLGSMGSGIGSAVGLALGDPGRRVVCVIGDGGMEMQGTELLVAVKHRLPLVVAVFNDARYNMVHHGYRSTFGHEASWETPQVDFVKWAESMGARGCRIERPGQITATLLEELTADGLPAVLDVRHDAQVRLRSSGRNQALDVMMGK